MSYLVGVKTQVDYSCGHNRLYRFASLPRTGDRLYCFECCEDIVVIDVGAEHWVFKCRSLHGVGGKLFIRHFGKRERLTCEIAAAKHRSRVAWRGHVVDVYAPGGELVKTYGDPETTPTLFGA